jgi:putative heme transporter
MHDERRGEPSTDDAADPVARPEVELESEPDPPTGTRSDPFAVEKAGDLRVPSWLDTAVQYTWRGIVLLAGVAAVLFTLTRLYLVSLPVIVALILSTLFVPPARRLERRGFPRLAAASIVVIGGIGIVAGIIALLTPEFIRQTQALGPTITAATNEVMNWLETGPLSWDRDEIDRIARNLMVSLEGSAGTIAQRVGTLAVAVVEGITALTLAVVLLFFFVKDGAQIVDWLIRRVPAHHRDDVRAAGSRGWVALSGFVRGTAAVALIDAVGIGVGLAIVGVPLVLPLSLLVFFGGFVPVIGAFVTGILAVLVALADLGLTAALIVAGIVLAVQQIESNVLQPTIMRRAVALHPVVILGVLTAGAVLIGIVGAFLAVPVAAVVAAVGNELRLRHEARHLGVEVGPAPLGGPGVDPELTLPQFPPDTDLRSRRRRNALPPADPAARAMLRRRKRRAEAAAAAAARAADEHAAIEAIEEAIEDAIADVEVHTHEAEDAERVAARHDDHEPDAAAGDAAGAAAASDGTAAAEAADGTAAADVPDPEDAGGPVDDDAGERDGTGGRRQG